MISREENMTNCVKFRQGGSPGSQAENPEEFTPLTLFLRGRHEKAYPLTLYAKES